jgi:ABC-type lipoprotein export system ATPase subunit
LPILTAENLKKTYHDSNQELHILRGINLEVESGEFSCISGQSGCGKSTLLHILGLLDKPDSGKILINDKEIVADSLDIPLLRNKLIGFVFQFHYLMEDLDAVENTALPMMISGKSKKESLKKAVDVLSLLGIAGRLHHYPHQLSGGEQQRVALARALINNPTIVLADEPTGNLDPDHRNDVLDLMLNINQSLGSAFLLVTHDERVARVAQTHYVLENGILQKTT